MKKDFISIQDLSTSQIFEIFDLAGEVKLKDSEFGKPLKDRTLVLIFQKPSNRTRVSFEVGMWQLGGNSLYLGPEDIGPGTRESIKDIAQVLSRYADGVVARTYQHSDIIEMARWASVPVINGLTDLLHPCQALTDIFTLKEKAGSLKELKLAFVGDGNNVLHSLLICCAKVGMQISVATPKGYEPKAEIVKVAKVLMETSGGQIFLTNTPEEAVKDADVIYTDVWTSMGKESEHSRRLNDFKGFQVNQRLVSFAKQGCWIMHCLPAHRGEEITDFVLDGPDSIVLDQAENRLHIQKAILIMLLSRRGY